MCLCVEMLEAVELHRKCSYLQLSSFISPVKGEHLDTEMEIHEMSLCSLTWWGYVDTSVHLSVGL